MMNGVTGKQYTEQELQEALYEVEDLMDQLLTPWFLLGKTAECIKFKRVLEGDGIDIGIRDKSLTQFVYDIMWDKFKLAKDDIKDGFTINAVNGVPIRVKVYIKNYYFFKYPDHVVYNYGTYMLPNPFETYYKMRYLIK